MWQYRGHKLKKLEWGLWTATDEPERYFLCYRPEGRDGPVVRRWVTVDGQTLSVDDLRQHVRRIRAEIQSRKLGLTVDVEIEVSTEEFLRELERLNRSQSYIDTVERSLDAFTDFTGAESVAEIGVPSIERFLGSLAEDKLAPLTVNKYRAHLSSWLDWATRRGQIDANPTERVQPAKVETTYKDFPSPEEMRNLVDASSEYDASIWTLLALSGLRRGSFLSLEPSRIRENGLVVDTKRRQEWFLSYDDGCPLWGPELSEMARAVWQERPPTPDYMRFHFEEARESVNPNITIHSLRHAFCSWLVMMGEHLQDVAAWAHHSSARTTEKWYAHLRPRGVRLLCSSDTSSCILRASVG